MQLMSHVALKNKLSQSGDYIMKLNKKHNPNNIIKKKSVMEVG